MAKKKVEETKIVEPIKKNDKVKFQFKSNVRYGFSKDEIIEFKFNTIYEIERELAEEFVRESVGIIIE